MTKELKTLKNIENFIFNGSSIDLSKELSIIEKALKAFEIIKKKMVNMAIIFNRENADEYNVWCSRCGCLENEYITREEFNLLKEALK